MHSGIPLLLKSKKPILIRGNMEQDDMNQAYLVREYQMVLMSLA